MYQDGQLELFQHHMKFYPDQPTSVQKNKTKKVLLCAELVTLSHSQGHRKWNKMAEVNGAYKQSRYEKVGLKSVHLMPHVKVFVT